MKINKNYTIADIETQIENGVAVPVKSAGFNQGDEMEIQTILVIVFSTSLDKTLSAHSRIVLPQQLLARTIY